jgi:predicted permease
MIVISFLISSLGVYIAASGRAPASLAIRRVVTIPVLYAAILGLVVNLGRFEVPEPLAKAVHILGQAAVPTMLLVLGIQLVATFGEKRGQLPVPAPVAVTILRLMVAPAVAWTFALLLGLPKLGKDVIVLESAMPTGVMATILANEFGADSRFSALCVVITTLVSLPTITLLLNWLS